jgi:hypothetical protein
MDLVISVLTVIWSSYLVFCFLFTTFFLFRLTCGIKKAIATDEVGPLTAVMLVNVELINDRWMMYDTLTDRFICQATTEDELWALAKELFPSQELLIK